MPTPFPPRQAASMRLTGATKSQPTTSNSEWRCTRCAKLLGVRREGRIHLRFARGHEYLVSLPATATCRGCGILNRAIAPTR